MAWTYGGDPAANDRDKIRFLVQDTDVVDQLLSDEEIAWLLTKNGVQESAAEAAEAIAAKFSRKADTTVGEVRVALGQRAEGYRKLAASLRARTGIEAEVYAGGLSRDEKTSDAEDTDLVQPTFTRGQMDNPLAPGQDQKIREN